MRAPAGSGIDSKKRGVRLLVLALVSIAIGIMVATHVPKPLPELSRAEFLDEVRNGHVQEVEIEDNQVIIGTSTTRGKFRTDLKPNQDELVAELRAHGIEVRYVDTGPGLI